MQSESNNIQILAGNQCPKCRHYGLFECGAFWQCEECLAKWYYDPRIKK